MTCDTKNLLELLKSLCIATNILLLFKRKTQTIILFWFPIFPIEYRNALHFLFILDVLDLPDLLHLPSGNILG